MMSSLKKPRVVSSASIPHEVHFATPERDELEEGEEVGGVALGSSSASGKHKLTRAQKFAQLLEETTSHVEVMLELMEGTSHDDPVVLGDDVASTSAILLYCNDSLSRMEGTLSSCTPDPDTSLRENYFSLQNEKYLTSGKSTDAHASLLSTHSVYTEGPDGKRVRKKERFTRRVIRWLALGSVLWQVFSILLLMLIGFILNKNHDEDDSGAMWVKMTLGILAFLQVAQVITIVCVMYKIGMQIAHHTLSMETLIQSYLTTVVGMGGIYFLFMAINSSSFVGIDKKWHGEAPKHVVTTTTSNQWALMLHMIYLSSTIMTGCGFGDITPRTWYAVLAVTLEQLLSVTFATVIFGLGLQHFTTRIHIRRKALAAKSLQEEGADGAWNAEV